MTTFHLAFPLIFSPFRKQIEGGGNSYQLAQIWITRRAEVGGIPGKSSVSKIDSIKSERYD